MEKKERNKLKRHILGELSRIIIEGDYARESNKIKAVKMRHHFINDFGFSETGLMLCSIRAQRKLGATINEDDEGSIRTVADFVNLIIKKKEEQTLQTT